MYPLEIITKLEHAGLVPPETLTIAITGECNLRCAHCWVDAGLAASVAWLPIDTGQRLVEEFAGLGGTSVRVTGGEPLLHPDWFELLRIINAAGLKVLLQTNGMLFGDDNLQALQTLKLKQLNIQISLDGATAAVHDQVRGAGAYAQVLRGLRRLIGAGFGNNIALFFTEMHHNLHQLPDLLLLAEQLGVGVVSSGSLVNCGQAKGNEDIAPPDPEQYQFLLARYAEDHTFLQLYDIIGNTAALEWCGLDRSPPGCSFIRNPYLTATGILYPCLLCHAAAYSVAGVFEKGLADVLLEGIPLWAALQKISRQRVGSMADCQQCALLKSCAGGCMGRAWGSFGEFLVAEDRCQQRKAVWRYKEKP